MSSSRGSYFDFEDENRDENRDENEKLEIDRNVLNY